MNIKSSAPGRNKEAAKFWDGYELHPFVEKFHFLLETMGFDFDSEEDGRFYSWKKSAFPGYGFSVLVGANGSAHKRGEFGFNLILLVESERQMQIEKDLRISECHASDGLSSARPPERDVAVLNVSLAWLMARWNPRLENPGESYLRWQSLHTSDAEEIARDAISFLGKHGADFFEYVGDPLRLANVLLDIKGFPGREIGGVPGTAAVSFAPELYAAGILFDSGMLGDARNAVRRFADRHQEKFERDEIGEVEMEIAKCKAEKYMAWMGPAVSLS